MRKLSCGERDEILLDPETKRVADGWVVASSLTDAHGEFGDPRIANAASEAAIQTKALRDAANAWTQGAWAEKLPPSDAIRPQIILGVANAAGDFLRARADEIEGSARK